MLEGFSFKYKSNNRNAGFINSEAKRSLILGSVPQCGKVLTYWGSDAVFSFCFYEKISGFSFNMSYNSSVIFTVLQTRTVASPNFPKYMAPLSWKI